MFKHIHTECGVLYMKQLFLLSTKTKLTYVFHPQVFSPHIALIVPLFVSSYLQVNTVKYKA